MGRLFDKYGAIIPLLMGIGLLSFVFYTCAHQYTNDTITTRVKINNEIVKDEQSGRNTYEVFYFVCTDKNRVYRISTKSFKDYPMALPNDSFLIKVTRGVPTKWANKHDTIISDVQIIKQL